MHRRTAVIATAVAGTLVVRTALKRRAAKADAEHMRRVAEKTSREIAGILFAADQIGKLTSAGKYDKTGLAAIENDFEFYQITYRNS